MTRFLDENPQVIGEKKLVIAPAKGADEIDSSPCAVAYSELCSRLVEQNQAILNCLHCGKAISEDRSLVAEIDNNHFQHAVGLIHRDCLRPIDRVLGIIKSQFFENHSYQIGK